MVDYKNANLKFWKNKKVLVTGHSGFKGSWLSFWLNNLGAKVFGLSLKPLRTNDLFHLLKLGEKIESRFFDIRDLYKVKKCFDEVRPEIVFHLAAQPIVLKSYEEPVETIETNFLGTLNVLESVRYLGDPLALIVVTTDKVYKNREWEWPYRECDALGGNDPYSSSKACCELLVNCYANSFFRDSNKSVVTARAGNVIGGGDWSEYRLIPDAIKAWQNDGSLIIRNQNAIRPWQHVIEPIFGYLKLAEFITYGNIKYDTYNFGPVPNDCKTVGEILEIAKFYYGKCCKVDYDKSSPAREESKILKLDISKSNYQFGFYPRWDTRRAVEKTVKWYKKLHDGAEADRLCSDDIDDYTL